MKNYFKNIFSKDCSWIEYLSFGISLFMLIVSIAYLIINPGELKIEDYSRTFAFIMFLIYFLFPGKNKTTISVLEKIVMML